MSWHFSQALVEAYWGGRSSDGQPLEGSNLSLTKEAPLPRDKTMLLSGHSPSGTMYAPSTVQSGEDVLTWFLEDSPARMSLSEARQKLESTENEADSGGSRHESFVKWSPITRSWKTPQLSLFEDLEESYPIWPRWGLMQDGECSPLPMLAHDTSVRGSLSLPTITKSWDTRGPGLSNNLDNLRASLGTTEFTLQIIEAIGWRWPTSFLETIMMWPVGWNRHRPLETVKFQQWLDSHGKL